eukprot:1157351-Pelagomonas_calceolata.AAC.2
MGGRLMPRVEVAHKGLNKPIWPSLRPCLTDALYIFCLAGRDQQAEQSNHVAEGQNPMQLNS